MAGAKPDAATWAKVRGLIIRANRAAPNDPLPLSAFYEWHELAGIKPPAVAVAGLRRALELAPQVSGLRLTLAAHLIGEAKRDDARVVLAPLLNDPHSSEVRAAARALLDGAKTDKPATDATASK